MGGISRSSVNWKPRIYHELSGGKVFYVIRYSPDLPAFGIYETLRDAEQALLNMTEGKIVTP